MINNGPVNIGTNIEHVDGIDNRHITIVNPVVPEDQPQPTQDVVSTEPKPRKAPSKTKSAIQLKDFKGNKIGFLRVIKALHKDGYFETLDGGRPTEEEVFAAFGIAVNENLDDAPGQLSSNRKDNTPETRADVFDQLKKVYLKYERDIESKKSSRSSDEEK